MMLDPLAQQIGAGGIFALLIITLVMKMLPKVLESVKEQKHNSGENNGQSGDKSVSFWRAEMRNAVKQELENYDKGRLDKIRDIIGDELDKRTIIRKSSR